MQCAFGGEERVGVSMLFQRKQKHLQRSQCGMIADEWCYDDIGTDELKIGLAIDPYWISDNLVAKTSRLVLCKFSFKMELFYVYKSKNVHCFLFTCTEYYKIIYPIVGKKSVQIKSEIGVTSFCLRNRKPKQT